MFVQNFLLTDVSDGGVEVSWDYIGFAVDEASHGGRAHIYVREPIPAAMLFPFGAVIRSVADGDDALRGSSVGVCLLEYEPPGGAPVYLDLNPARTDPRRLGLLLPSHACLGYHLQLSCPGLPPTVEVVHFVESVPGRPVHFSHNEGDLYVRTLSALPEGARFVVDATVYPACLSWGANAVDCGPSVGSADGVVPPSAPGCCTVRMDRFRTASSTWSSYDEAEPRFAAGANDSDSEGGVIALGVSSGGSSPMYYETGGDPYTFCAHVIPLEGLTCAPLRSPGRRRIAGAAVPLVGVPPVSRAGPRSSPSFIVVAAPALPDHFLGGPGPTVPAVHCAPSSSSTLVGEGVPVSAVLGECTSMGMVVVPSASAPQDFAIPLMGVDALPVSFTRTGRDWPVEYAAVWRAILSSGRLEPNSVEKAALTAHVKAEQSVLNRYVKSLAARERGSSLPVARVPVCGASGRRAPVTRVTVLSKKRALVDGEPESTTLLHEHALPEGAPLAVRAAARQSARACAPSTGPTLPPLMEMTLEQAILWQQRSVAESEAAEAAYLTMLPLSMEAIREAHSLMHAPLRRVNIALRDAGDARDAVEAVRLRIAVGHQSGIAAVDGDL